MRFKVGNVVLLPVFHNDNIGIVTAVKRNEIGVVWVQEDYLYQMYIKNSKSRLFHQIIIVSHEYNNKLLELVLGNENNR